MGQKEQTGGYHHRHPSAAIEVLPGITKRPHGGNIGTETYYMAIYLTH